MTSQNILCSFDSHMCAGLHLSITLTQGGRSRLGLRPRLLDPEMNKMSFTFLENGLPWCWSLLFLFEQPGSPPDFSAALQRSRALSSSEPLPARMVDALKRLAVLVEPSTCLLIPAVACGCAPSRALVPREASSNEGGLGRPEPRSASSCSRSASASRCASSRSAASDACVAGSPPCQGSNYRRPVRATMILPSAAPRCSS